LTKNLPLVVVFSIAMLGKEYQENVSSGMNVAAAASAEYLSAIQVTRTLGYWIGIKQSTSQTICLALIDLCLISL